MTGNKTSPHHADTRVLKSIASWAALAAVEHKRNLGMASHQYNNLHFIARIWLFKPRFNHEHQDLPGLSPGMPWPAATYDEQPYLNFVSDAINSSVPHDITIHSTAVDLAAGLAEEVISAIMSDSNPSRLGANYLESSVMSRSQIQYCRLTLSSLVPSPQCQT